MLSQQLYARTALMFFNEQR